MMNERLHTLIPNTLYEQDLISIQALQRSQMENILTTAASFKRQQPAQLLADKVIAHCFFEPSTRTRLSFETATLRLGGKVIGFGSHEALSIKKGESLADTIRVIADYADLMVIRHPREGAARLAADVANIPVINAGDGANQHPTQAILDLFTIQECQQRVDGLSIALVGDLKYGRTIHSFVQACMLFDVRLYLVAPETLSLPESLCDLLRKQGVRFSFHQTMEEVIPKVDILYLTRLQQERFSGGEDMQRHKAFVLNAAMLSQARPHLKILHPLPRLEELDTSVDATPYAHYFVQAKNGVYVRQALLALLLNKEW